MRTLVYAVLLMSVPCLPAGPVREASFLTSSWVMLEPISNAAGDKQDEFYQNTYMTLKSVPWKKTALELQVPFVYVAQTDGAGMERFRFGVGDVMFKPVYRFAFVAASCGIGIPAGYGYDTSGDESLWIGPASWSVRPAVELNGYHAPSRVAAGSEFRYTRYLSDGMVGWGSWQTGVKGYLARSWGKTGTGLVLEGTFKSINYYTEGILASTGQPGKGYGDVLEQAEVTGGAFASYPLAERAEIAGGISYALYADEAPVGAGLWLQVKKRFE